MTVLSDYMSGTISLANGSATVTGTGTLFEATKFREGDTLQIQNLTAVIASVDSDTQLTLTEPWTGLDIVDGAYRARQLGDGSRVSTQAATIIELLGNGVLMNLAELGVEEGKVPVGGPTGEYELVDKGQLGIQDPNGTLGELAVLTLEASKILNTDASGNLTQSDITAAALAMIASPTPAVTSLGYTPVNKAGDSGLKALSWDEVPSNWHQRFTATVTLAVSANYLFSAGSGLIIATDATTAGTGSVGVFLVGGGGCKLLGQSAGTIFADTPTANTLFMQYASGSGYYLANATGAGKLLSFAAFRTKDTP